MIATPNLTPEDVANMKQFSAKMDIAGPVKVEWVLYGEESWKHWREAIVDAGLT